MASGNTGRAVYLIYSEGLTNHTYLTSKGKAGLRLPVAPLDQVQITQNINTTANILPLAGSVVFGGGPGLTSVSFNSLLPLETTEPYSHIYTDQYQYISPAEIDAQLRDMASKNVVFELVISDGDTDAGRDVASTYTGSESVLYHELAMIDSYSVTDQEGGSLWYDISFTQYRRLKSTTVQAQTTKIGPEFFTVTKKVQTLEAIAKKFRAQKLTWQKLKTLNKNPQLKQPNGDKVINQKQKIKIGTKVRLRKHRNQETQPTIDNKLIV